jgi:hypothetical protein
MNERIKELAEQAELELTIETKKFAELIVKECAGIADEYDGVGSTIVSRIQKHFGVEK